MENEVRAAMATRGSSAEQSPAASRIPAKAEEQDSLIRASHDARVALEEAIAASAEAVQRARTVSAQLEVRLAEITREAALPDPPLDDLATLSRREMEVLALVAAGHTNKAIADALYLSPNTIKTHVSSLLTKLQAGTRVQLAVIAAQLMPLQA